jgi:hypothetical protein
VSIEEIPFDQVEAGQADDHHIHQVKSFDPRMNASGCRLQRHLGLGLLPARAEASGVDDLRIMAIRTL